MTVARLQRALHHLPLRVVVVLSITFSVAVVTALGAAIFVRTDVADFLATSRDAATTAVRVLGQDIARLLVLDEPAVAADAVSRLQAFPALSHTFIYDESGRLRLRYARDGTHDVQPPPRPELVHVPDTMGFLLPIDYEGRRYGTALFLVSDRSVRTQLAQRFSTLGWLVPLLIGAAALLGTVFGRMLSTPLFNVARTVRRISDRQDYSLRVDAGLGNEIGLLARGINLMLDRIESDNRTLHQQKERLEVTLESIGDGVITTDTAGVIEYVNPVGLEMLGATLPEVAGHPASEVLRLHDEHRDEAPRDPVRSCIAEGTVIKVPRQVVLRRRDGQQLAVEASAAPIRGCGGDPNGAIVVVRDVTQSRKLTEELSHQASHDRLTGLVNRYEFERRVEATLAPSGQDDRENALFYIDLDQFKVVNDTCGHAAGDQLLRQFAVELGRQIRRHDTLARLGGDEFAVLLQDCPLAQAVMLAEQLRERAQQIRFTWDGRTFVVRTSIGIVPIGAPGDTVESVMSAADAACYAAKDGGRNRVHVCRPGDADLARRRGEMGIVAGLQEALEHDRFELYCQRIRSLPHDNRERLHCEVLLRMRDDAGRLIAPGAFLGAAERFDLMPSIDRWVVQRLFRTLREHPRALERLEMCAVNLSGLTLMDDTFLDFVVSEFARTGVPCGKICFEITETVAVANLEKARTFMGALRAHGVRFALDDFGSGMSSFYYLRNLPSDFLKIDGGFVRNMANDPIDAAMVRSINEIGKLLGKQTVAEFVEDEATITLLSAVGVDYGQGYGIAIPAPLTEVLTDHPRAQTMAAGESQPPLEVA